MVINLKKYLTRIEKQSVLKNSMSRTTPILYTCCVTQAPIYSSGLSGRCEQQEAVLSSEWWEFG